jgi:UDP-N-acetylglucosamine acyltransferase
MSTDIHPSASIAKGAELADGVKIGPFAVVGPDVKIGKGTTVHAHASVSGHTTLGEGNVIYPYASVGSEPQDLTYKGEPTKLTIGNRNQIREFTTLNLGTIKGGGLTSIGDENLFMAYTHVAHDCHVGNRCVMTNGSMLAGHVTLQDYVILGGASAIYQFTRMGAHAFITAGAMIGRDVPPFCIASGEGGLLFGLNTIGLKRRGFSKDAILGLKRAYKLAFRSGLKVPEAVPKLKSEFASVPEVQQFAEFLGGAGARGVLQDAGKMRHKAGAAPEGSETDD